MARQNAVDVAHLLGSKAVSYRRIVVGEPRCLYRIPFHAEDFWFKVLVSDTDFIFTGEHRRRESFTVPFCATIKDSWQNLGATTLLPALTAELGIPVYTQAGHSEGTVSSYLLSPVIFKFIRECNKVATTL